MRECACEGQGEGITDNGDCKLDLVWDWNLVGLGLGLYLTWVVWDELDNWRSLLGMGKAWGGV